MSASDLPPQVGDNGPRKPGRPTGKAVLSPSALEGLSAEELTALRSRIDERLPLSSLKSVNMEQELVMQLRLAQKLQRDTLEDNDDMPAPANQKAQVINSVAGTLQMLGKLQVELYDSERLKRIEQILIQTLQLLPLDAQEGFLKEYELHIGRLD